MEDRYKKKFNEHEGDFDSLLEELKFKNIEGVTLFGHSGWIASLINKIQYTLKPGHSIKFWTNSNSEIQILKDDFIRYHYDKHMNSFEIQCKSYKGARINLK